MNVEALIHAVNGVDLLLFFFAFEGMGNHLENLVYSLKSKIKGLKFKNPYRKMDKSDSMLIEAWSRHRQKLIAKTLQAADQPGKKDVGVWIFLMQILEFCVQVITSLLKLSWDLDGEIESSMCKLLCIFHNKILQVLM